MVAKRDLGSQLQRLYNIAVYNLREAETERGRAHAEGQRNAFRAVAVSYGLELVG